METLGIIFYLHPYSNNLLKRLVKTPKLYFYDTGLVCYLTKWSSAETLESGTMNGAILENYVVAEIRKTSNPGTELIKVFGLLDKASTPRSKGAVVCIKPSLGAIDKDNYIIPIWMI